MTEEELLDEVIDQAVDCALELMGERRISTCDTPPSLRLARAGARSLSDLQGRVSSDKGPAATDRRGLPGPHRRRRRACAVRVGRPNDQWPIFTRHGQPVRFKLPC